MYLIVLPSNQLAINIFYLYIKVLYSAIRVVLVLDGIENEHEYS